MPSLILDSHRSVWPTIDSFEKMLLSFIIKPFAESCNITPMKSLEFLLCDIVVFVFRLKEFRCSIPEPRTQLKGEHSNHSFWFTVTNSLIFVSAISRRVLWNARWLFCVLTTTLLTSPFPISERDLPPRDRLLLMQFFCLHYPIRHSNSRSDCAVVLALPMTIR